MIILVFTCFYPASNFAAESTAISERGKIITNKYVDYGSYAFNRGNILVAAHNLDTLLIPASISKLLTSLLAIKTLGLEYRFKTEFYTDNRDLYIKGYGDPFLVSEEIAQIFKSLGKKGVTEIRSIFIDNSSFDLSTATDGAGNSLNPYDVIPGGLVVNFNTVNIIKRPDGGIDTAEPQTPYLPVMEKLGKHIPVGTHRINVSNDPENVQVLAGQLFRAFQEKAAIPGSGPIKKKKAPKTATLVHTHYSSKDLDELLTGMLLYSNNFTANQLFLTAGAKTNGYPATWDKARSAMDRFIGSDPKLAETGITIIEGSGLSRGNKISARAMLRVLELFKPYAYLLPAENGLLIKSGTLTGVYSYAGYLPRGNHLDSFVIILNQKRNTRSQILNLLKKNNHID